jgi:hypothetical protein
MRLDNSTTQRSVECSDRQSRLKRGGRLWFHKNSRPWCACFSRQSQCAVPHHPSDLVKTLADKLPYRMPPDNTGQGRLPLPTYRTSETIDANHLKRISFAKRDDVTQPGHPIRCQPCAHIRSRAPAGQRLSSETVKLLGFFFRAPLERKIDLAALCHNLLSHNSFRSKNGKNRLPFLLDP